MSAASSSSSSSSSSSCRGSGSSSKRTCSGCLTDKSGGSEVDAMHDDGFSEEESARSRLMRRRLESLLMSK